MKTKEVKFKEKKEELVYSSSNGNYLGKIFLDFEGDYLFRPRFCLFLSSLLGKGKVLKEIAERLIELNYGKNNKK